MVAVGGRTLAPVCAVCVRVGSNRCLAHVQALHGGGNG